MLVTMGQREKLELAEKLKDGKVLSSTLENILIASSRKSSWDGYVHPSSLDWNASVDSQMKSLRKEFIPSVFTLKRMAVGTIIHDYIQEMQHQTFFRGKSEREVHLTSDALLFRGTPDQYGEHKHMGKVLLEYKSVSSYQRDKSFGEKIVKKMVSGGAWQLLSEEDQQKAFDRLCIKYIDYKEPESAHLTQAFTYAFIQKKLLGQMPDWICVCYIRKESLDTMEFWYEVSKHQDLLKRAIENYKAVLQATFSDVTGKEIRAKWKSKKESTTATDATQNSAST